MEDNKLDIGISQLYLRQCLQEAFGPRAVVESVQLEKPLGGHGFLSHVTKVCPKWPDGHFPRSLIIKVPTLDNWGDMGKTEQAREKMKDVLSFVHGVECDIYELFGDNAPIPVPKCYMAQRGSPQRPPLLVLEDMSDSANVPNLIDGMSLGQTLAVTEALARLHGWSMVTSTDWRNCVFNMVERETRAELYKGLIGTMVDDCKNLKQLYPKVFGSLDLTLIQGISNFECTLMYANLHRNFMDDVLIHGDLWAYNLLFEKKANGETGDKLMAVIDFQFAMKGSPMFDLARLMTVSVPENIRRNHIDHILQHYYNTLKTVAGDQFSASLHQLELLYHQQFAHFTFFILRAFPVILKAAVKSEGEEWTNDFSILSARMKAAYDDATMTMEKCCS